MSCTFCIRANISLRTVTAFTQVTKTHETQTNLKNQCSSLLNWDLFAIGRRRTQTPVHALADERSGSVTARELQRVSVLIALLQVVQNGNSVDIGSVPEHVTIQYALHLKRWGCLDMEKLLLVQRQETVGDLALFIQLDT